MAISPDNLLKALTEKEASQCDALEEQFDLELNVKYKGYPIRLYCDPLSNSVQEELRDRYKKWSLTFDIESDENTTSHFVLFEAKDA